MDEIKYCNCGGELKEEIGFAGITWAMCQSCRMSQPMTKKELRRAILEDWKAEQQTTNDDDQPATDAREDETE
jgi:hypothetical protein